MRRRLIPALVFATLALAGPTVAAAREPFPYDFHRNMGYCAPYLAQLTRPDGSRVRPFVNHLIHDLTSAGPFLGQKNVGDLYSDRARSEDDRNCLPRP